LKHPENYALILAGGLSLRTGEHTLKQFRFLCGKPLFVYSAQVFREKVPEGNIIIVVPDSGLEVLENYLRTWPWLSACRFVTGGDERFYSVKSGLQYLPESGMVAVHDAARPLLASEMVQQGFELARTHQTAVPVVELRESLRKMDGERSDALNRKSYRIVQTPQFFNIGLLKQAYSAVGYKVEYTDDASVVEAAGGAIHLFAGDERNIKITTATDFTIAEALIRKRVD